MENMLKIILLLSLFLIVYNHFLYPLLIVVLSKIINNRHISIVGAPEADSDKSIHAEDIVKLMAYPKVSFIIAAYNEENVIRDKLDNTLSLNYPDNSFEIIVVSDGSDDRTADIVKPFSESGVISLHEDARSGKTSALNRAVSNASGEILVFSDANNDFSTNAIIELVKHFCDDAIGAVTGAKHIYRSDDRESAVGDGLYWKYESYIKTAESKLGSITAADGEIVAVRKNLFKPINPELINDDAAITFDIIRSGHRIIYEPEARSYEQASEDLIDDINVKIRMTAGGYQTISHEWKYLFPPLNWFSFSFISHKILRWITPHLMLLTFISSMLLSILLSASTVYFLVFLAQIAFYLIAFYGWSQRKTSSMSTFIYIPMYFTVMNIALFIGFIRFMKKKQGVNWVKARR